MPGPRRTLSRTQSNPSAPNNTPKTKVETAGQVPSDEADAMNPLASLLLQPKHAHIPEILPESNFMFEGMVFFYGVTSLCLQYINLYKTVWWLPHSHANYALNFYLIDPYLAALLVIIMSRRLVWVFVDEIYCVRSKRSCFYWLLHMLKIVVVVGLAASLVYTSYHIILRHSLLYSLFLCYPLATYVSLFGLNVKPLFGKVILLGSLGAGDKGTPKHKPKDAQPSPTTDVPSHNCSMSPEAIRDEVEILKTDFNNRIKQVLFNSMLCAYYLGFVPLCFAQNTLYYDTWWVCQHIGLVWISTFVMFMMHFLPTKYIDILHRCALHLGRWIKVEGRHAHVPYNAWSELQVWQQGALVKHVRGLFKADGVNNSAEPGNGMHARFYFMFNQPLRVTNWLLIITWGLIIYQFIQLLQSTEWSQMTSMALLLFCNYNVLFKLMRNKLVLNRAYKDEQVNWQQQQ